MSDANSQQRKLYVGMHDGVCSLNSADGGRLYSSDDRGQSWEPMPISLPAIAVGALVVAPV